jgi:hypothetical protein
VSEDSNPDGPGTGVDDPSDADRPPSEVVDDTPTVTCTRCDREWDLAHELDDLAVGNQAVEQFALDHRRHTGHFPDDVATWRAECRRCPAESEHLAERGARRWARTHARHTRHEVAIHHTGTETVVVGPGDAGRDAGQEPGGDGD